MNTRRRFITLAAAGGAAGLALSRFPDALAAGTAAAASAVPAEDPLFLDGLSLPIGPAGRCDDARVGGPVVRWDPAIRQWRMWYYCRSNRFAAGMAPAFGSGDIATAVSPDGRRWQRVDGPLREGAVMIPAANRDAFDSTHVATGDVIRHGNEWIMLYHGGNHEVPQDTDPEYRFPGYRLRLGVARSTDGLNWTRARGKATGGAILEIPDGDVYAAFPNLLHDGRRFIAQYTTVDRLGRWYRTRLATSTNLVDWQDAGDLAWEHDPLPFEGGGVITRDVVPNPLPGGPKWLMVYTAKDGRAEANGRRSIAVAVSDDGMRWRRLYDEPVFFVGRHGGWDSAGAANPRLVVTDTDMRLYYYGWSDKSFVGHPARGIGCAFAPGRELRRFRRIAAG